MWIVFTNTQTKTTSAKRDGFCLVKPYVKPLGKTYGSQETKFNLREAYISRSPIGLARHKG